MTNPILATVIIGWAFVPPAVHQDSAKALELVKDSIRAHGGFLAMSKLQIMQRTASGNMSFLGQDKPIRDELTAELPGKCRWNLEIGSADQRIRLIVCVTPEKGWQDNGLATTEMPKERAEEIREEAYVLWLSTLVPLARESSLQLALLPQATVQGNSAAAVKVTSKGHGDVTLFFDAKTNLLIKMQRQAIEAGLKVDKEYLFSDHKDFEGILLPAKYEERLAGRKFVDMRSLSYRFPPRFEPTVFTKP